ncbi:hypothetical protein BY996DRAFT_2963150 [Phakopsora pachyrhizi]|nr:hypothetical protein BY996DRAFT_2963150 [Phakopsora pachyrhizi]
MVLDPIQIKVGFINHLLQSPLGINSQAGTSFDPEHQLHPEKVLALTSSPLSSFLSSSMSKNGSGMGDDPLITPPGSPSLSGLVGSIISPHITQRRAAFQLPRSDKMWQEDSPFDSGFLIPQLRFQEVDYIKSDDPKGKKPQSYQGGEEDEEEEEELKTPTPASCIQFEDSDQQHSTPSCLDDLNRLQNHEKNMWAYEDQQKNYEGTGPTEDEPDDLPSLVYDSEVSYLKPSCEPLISRFPSPPTTRKLNNLEKQLIQSPVNSFKPIFLKQKNYQSPQPSSTLYDSLIHPHHLGSNTSTPTLSTPEGSPGSRILDSYSRASVSSSSKNDLINFNLSPYKHHESDRVDNIGPDHLESSSRMMLSLDC